MKKNIDDDLFRSTEMTFGEHIEELRGALFRAILGLVAGAIIGLAIGRQVVHTIEAPLKKALGDYYETKATKRLTEEYGDRLSPQLLDIVTTQHMIFEEVYVQPSTILESLQSNYPDQAQHVAQLPELQLRPQDIKAPKELAVRLVAASQSDDASSGSQVWQALTADERRAVEEIASQEAAPSSEQIQALAAGLSRLTSEQEFYNAKAWSIEPSEIAREMLDRRDSLSKSELRRLNWRLLAESFPRELALPHSTLVPMLIWRKTEDDFRVRVTSLNPQEAFIIYMKASLITGAILSSPWIFYQIWSFVAAGLYPHEKKYIHIFLPFSIVLFLSGALLAFGFVFQPVLDFLFGFNDWLGIDPDPRISEWMSFVLFMPLGFGISFQLPLVMLFMEKIGLFTVASYWAKWKIAIIIIFVLSAILTPSPDPYSMLLMAVPLTGLYFGGIGLCNWLGRK